MRSALSPALFAATLVAAAAVAAPSSAMTPLPSLMQPADAPLPGLTEEIDQSLWCATMATHLAHKALQHGDVATFELLAPLAGQLTRQVASVFVAMHMGEPDISSYLDLYQSEIVAVLAGTAPERYAPEQCKGSVVLAVSV